MLIFYNFPRIIRQFVTNNSIIINYKGDKDFLIFSEKLLIIYFTLLIN